MFRPEVIFGWLSSKQLTKRFALKYSDKYVRMYVSTAVNCSTRQIPLSIPTLCPNIHAHIQTGCVRYSRFRFPSPDSHCTLHSCYVATADSEVLHNCHWNSREAPQFQCFPHMSDCSVQTGQETLMHMTEIITLITPHDCNTTWG